MSFNIPFRFVNIIEHEGSGYYFSYNPCYGYTLGNKNSSCGGRLGRVAVHIIKSTLLFVSLLI